VQDQTPTWFLTLQTVGLFAQVVATIFVGYGLIVSRRQLKAMEKQVTVTGDTSKHQLYFELIKYLESYRHDRKTVFEANETKRSPLGWTVEEKAAAHRVCASFNLAGILVKNNLAPNELIIGAFYSAMTTYRILEPLIIDVRESRGEQYWKYFDWLAHEMEHHQKGKSHSSHFQR
jgi:hypothetical protein